MAPRRLSDSEKQDLVGRYKAGESTAALAEAFGCSPNTVSRTVKSLLPADAYAALKASRLKGATAQPLPEPKTPEPVQSEAPASSEKASAQHQPTTESLEEADSSLALDDADDFGEDPDDELADDPLILCQLLLLEPEHLVVSLAASRRHRSGIGYICRNFLDT